MEKQFKIYLHNKISDILIVKGHNVIHAETGSTLITDAGGLIVCVAPPSACVELMPVKVYTEEEIKNQIAELHELIK
jgi:hypothetical protein